jgi:uncharacterized membrane protein
MSDLVAIAYPDLATAQEVASNAARAQQSHLLELDDMVVIERRDDGKIKLHQPSLAAVGAASGALWGGLIGLIFFVPLFGMAMGAAMGASAGALSDYGIDDRFMKDLGQELEPGGAALMLLVRKMSPDKILPNIQIEGRVIQTSLDDETEKQLADALSGAGARAGAGAAQ